MLEIGDRVEIMGRPGDTYAGKHGEIVHIATGIKPVTQPAVLNIPKQGTEPHYSVKLNSGEVVHYLREQQLRKL
jgi:hypothetical protein